MANLSRLEALKRKAKAEGWSQWIRSTADERAVLNGCWYDISKAERFEHFCNKFLRLFKGEWKNKPVTLLPWQRDDFTFPLYGWRRLNEKGREVRRYKRFYCQIPKKNGKSTLVAAMAIYHLVGDGEAGPEVYCAANDQPQAGRVHQESQSMVLRSPALKKVLKVIPSEFLIQFPRMNGVYKAISSDPASQEGLNASAIFADEMHSWYGRELYDCIQWAGIAREQPIFGVITTSGDDMQSVCYEMYQYACGVRDGVHHDDEFLPVIFEADPDCSILDEAQWYKANPSLGHTISLDSFRKDAYRASKTPANTVAFRRYRLNQWIGGGSQWINLADWNACQASYTADDLRGMHCRAGLDLSRTTDTTSLQLLFRMPDGKRRILSYFWLPRTTVDAQVDRVSYQPWADQGWITITETEVQDYEQILKDIAGLSRQFKIDEILFDPYGAEHLTQRLEDEYGIPRRSMAQNLKNFAAPVDELERRILSRTIEHNGNQVMTFQVGNCKVKSDSNGAKKPIKKHSDDWKKIDGPVALMMACAGDLDAGEHTGSATIRWM